MTTLTSPTTGPVPFCRTVDEDIVQIWRQVEDRVVQMAGGDQSKIKRNLDIKTVLQHLEETHVREPKAAEKNAAVKNIFNTTLQCIQTVGGIVADGAAYVFQPENTCYNALAFVIKAYEGYEGIFESLATLLEKCSDFLSRLECYRSSGMDSKLTKVACQHLQFFLEICDRSLKLKSKRSKFKAFMKQMLLNDDGVQDTLSRMEALVDKERGLVAVQTWKSSYEAAAYSRDGLNLTRKMHSTLVEDKNRLKHETELKKWKASIVNTLECDRSILDADGEGPWELTWKRHESNILEGTGEWVLQEPDFKEWISCSDFSRPILGIEGGDGSGKALLASSIILYLRKLRSEALGSRVVVAHNFWDKDTKTSSTKNDPMSVSRNLLCQLALADEPFMKSVVSICEKSRYFDSPLSMWTKLLLENEDRANIDVSFFIVLDGIGTDVELFTQLLRKFANSPGLGRVRILITGQKEVFESLYEAQVWHSRIPLGIRNKADAKLFINDRLDSMDIFKDTTRGGVVDMRREILKELQEATAGDYYKIGSVLDSIAKTDEVEEIQPGEIGIIRHYLLTVCPKDLHDRFGFDEFFDMKMVRKGNGICYDPDNAHITLVLRCLDVLDLDNPRPWRLFKSQAQGRGRYDAREAFTEQFATSSLLNIGPPLYSGFINWDGRSPIPDFLDESWNLWLFSDEGVKVIDEWFRDSAVIEKVQDSTVLKAFNKATGVDRHRALFCRMSAHFASTLFQGDTSVWMTFETFAFLLAFLKPGTNAVIGDIYQPTLESARLVEDWAKKELGVAEEEDSSWECHVAELLFRLKSEHIPPSAAEERARRALKLDPGNYRASFILAKVTESAVEAVEVLDSLTQQLLTDDEWRNEKQNTSLLAQMMLNLGDKLWESEDTQAKAVGAYSKALQVSSDDNILEALKPIFLNSADAEKWDDLVKMVQQLLRNESGLLGDVGILTAPHFWDPRARISQIFTQGLLSGKD